MGNPERESGNECTAVIHLRIQHGRQRKRKGNNLGKCEEVLQLWTWVSTGCAPWSCAQDVLVLAESDWHCDKQSMKWGLGEKSNRYYHELRPQSVRPQSFLNRISSLHRLLISSQFMRELSYQYDFEDKWHNTWLSLNSGRPLSSHSAAWRPFGDRQVSWQIRWAANK